MTVRALDVLRAIRDLHSISPKTQKPTLSDAALKGVLYALALRADDTGRCWPSLLTLARDAGVSRSTAKVAIKLLVELGHISKTARRVEGVLEADSNLYAIHVGRTLTEVGQPSTHLGQSSAGGGPDVGPRVGRTLTGGGPDVGQYLPNELPNGTAHGRFFALTGEQPPSVPVPKPKKKPKHTETEIAEKNLVVEVFIEAFEKAKGVRPMTIDAGDHAAAFKMAKRYGAEEACSIVRRAFQDAFVVEKNPTLKFIASRADAFRGNAKPAKMPITKPGIQPGERDANGAVVIGWKSRGRQ